MKEAWDWLLKGDGLHPVEQVRVAQLHRSTAGGDLAGPDKGRVNLLPI